MRKRRCMSRPHALERKLKTTTNVGEHVTCHANARAARVTARPQPPCKRWRCQMLRLVPSSWPTNHDTVLSRVKRATMRRVRALEGAFARRKNAHSYTTPLADWMGRWGKRAPPACRHAGKILLCTQQNASNRRAHLGCWVLRQPSSQSELELRVVV
jgi:hypothetical protein